MVPTGIQFFPFDLRDEGMKTVLDSSQEYLGTKYILPAMNYINQRQPYPRGELPHNPRNKVYYTDGGLYFIPDPKFYLDTDIIPVTTLEEGILGSNWLEDLLEEAKKRNLETIVWISALNGKQALSCPEANVIDLYGRRITGWLCPNNPGVRQFVRGILRDVASNFDVSGIFLDRIRFPEWGGKGKGIGGALSCFCPHCQSEAGKLGVDLRQLQHKIKSMIYDLKKQNGTNYSGLVHKWNAVDILKKGIMAKDIIELFKLRQVAIERLVADSKEAVYSVRPDCAFWLDLWPPSYAWLLGQDLQELGKCCDAIKTFTYHKLGGGIDIIQVLEEFSSELQVINIDQLWKIFCNFFAFPAPDTPDNFVKEGLGLGFIFEETKRAILEIGKNTKTFAGVQIWDITPEEVERSLLEALRTEPDGVIFYNYGRSPLENLLAVKGVLGI